MLDALTDPIVAGWSDKSKNKNGRRIPFMKKYTVPFGLTALLIFCVPQSQAGIVNNIWVAVFIWAYYLFYTLYMIPHNALLPEMIHDQGKLVNAYTFNSLFFVTGSALGYVTPMFVDMIKKAGQTPLMAWRLVFAIFTVIGIVLLLIPAFTIKETDYVDSVRPIAVLNILPGSMMADIIQYDTIKNGVNREGVFGAARSFLTKIGTSLAIMIVPSITVIGATAGENIGRLGLKITALVGGFICLIAVFVFVFYKEKEVLSTIKENAEKEN